MLSIVVGIRGLGLAPGWAQRWRWPLVALTVLALTTCAGIALTDSVRPQSVSGVVVVSSQQSSASAAGAMPRGRSISRADARGQDSYAVTLSLHGEGERRDVCVRWGVVGGRGFGFSQLASHGIYMRFVWCRPQAPGT